MRRLAIITLCLLSFLLYGCESNTTLKGVTYENYGFFTEQKKNPNVIYELSAPNIIAAIILCETIIVPVYIVGWELWHPIALKREYVPGALPQPEPQVIPTPQEPQTEPSQAEPQAPRYNDPKYDRYK